MAEPQRVYDDDQSEKPIDKPDLRALEGGGETTEPHHGHLKAVGDDESSETAVWLRKP